jgi:hypothetical protein
MKIQSFNIDSPLLSDFIEFANDHYKDDPYFTGQDSLPCEHLIKLFIVYEKDIIVGRAAALINTSLKYCGTRTGLIGWYECIDNDHAAESILAAACDFLFSNGCYWVIGPINGTTWNKYRLTVASQDRPFFLENYHKQWYPRHFQNNNFLPVASYYSSKIPLRETTDKRVEHFEQTLEKKGIHVRNFRIEKFDEEIEKIYKVCIKTFKSNFLYTPVDFISFEKMYEKVKVVLDPSLVKIAENCNGEPAGFLFAVPDLFDPLRSLAIIKTLAIIPGRTFQGLGTYLGTCVHKEMLKKGYTSVIHALIHESNISGNILSKDCSVYRRYILTGKQLT